MSYIVKKGCGKIMISKFNCDSFNEHGIFQYSLYSRALCCIFFGAASATSMAMIASDAFKYGLSCVYFTDMKNTKLGSRAHVNKVCWINMIIDYVNINIHDWIDTDSDIQHVDHVQSFHSWDGKKNKFNELKWCELWIKLSSFKKRIQIFICSFHYKMYLKVRKTCHITDNRLKTLWIKKKL